jgi:hypothetical protein
LGSYSLDGSLEDIPTFAAKFLPFIAEAFDRKIKEIFNLLSCPKASN